MTEAQWLAGGDMLRMLDHANRSAGKRKLRLFACSCCRRFLDLLPTPAARRALEVSEAVADGQARFAELAAAKRAIPVLHPRDPAEWASNCAHFTAGRVSAHAALSAYSTSAEAARRLGLAAGSSDPYYAGLLRDICGNPFRPITFDPAWRTEAVVALSRGMYEARDFAPIPVLADALEDAGCSHPDLLAHCRGDGPHVRGCWVVDLVLGKG